MRDLGVAPAAKLLLEREGHGQREQRKRHADGVTGGEDAEEHVGDEEQEVIEDVGQRWAYEDGQSDDACLLVRVHVSGVVAVEDGFCVEGQRNGVHQRQHRQVAHLHCVCKHDRQGAKSDENDHISKGNILQANTCGGKKERNEIFDSYNKQTKESLLHKSLFEHI